jgi:hypothetical protein
MVDVTNYSFSKELDSISKSKLVKVEFIYNKTPKGEKYNGKRYSFNIPEHEIRFEIKKNDVPEQRS